MLKKGISDFNYDYQAYNDYLGEMEGYHSKEERVNTRYIKRPKTIRKSKNKFKLLKKK